MEAGTNRDDPATKTSGRSVRGPRWWFPSLGEVPGSATFLGGAIVIGVFAANTALVLGRGRRPAAR